METLAEIEIDNNVILDGEGASDHELDMACRTRACRPTRLITGDLISTSTEGCDGGAAWFQR